VTNRKSLNLPQLFNYLEELQCRLLDLGSHVATPRQRSSVAQLDRTRFPETSVVWLEKHIDELDSQLPKLTTFILPSGGLAACHLHLARAVCRRAERQMIPLLQENEIDDTAFQFINRLSDFLFVTARYTCHSSSLQDAVYKKEKNYIKRHQPDVLNVFLSKWETHCPRC